MKKRTMKAKVVDYANSLQEIFKKEFSLPENFHASIKVTSSRKYFDSEDILAYCIREERSIVLHYNNIQINVQDSFKQHKKWYKKFCNMDITPKEFERTFVITGIMHEMLHLYQYISPNTLYRTSSRSEDKQIYESEFPVYIHTAYMFFKYRKELKEKFNILPLGVWQTFKILKYMMKALDKNGFRLQLALRPRYISKYWNVYISYSLPLYVKHDVTVCNRVLDRNVKYRVGSIDYLNSIYIASIMADEVEYNSHIEHIKDRERYYRLAREKFENEHKCNIIDMK